MSNTLALSIVSHNHVQDIKALLKSLTPTKDIIILIRDNFGTTEIESLRYNYPEHKIFIIPYDGIQRGYGLNHNLNFKYIRTNFPHVTHFAVVNPDIIFKKLNLEELFKTDNQVCAPITLDKNGQKTDFCRTDKGILNTIITYFFKRGRVSKHFNKNLSKKQWFSGAFLLFQKETYERLNGFNTEYFMYYEDADLCRRAHKLDIRLSILNESVIIHEGKRKSFKNLKHLNWHLKSLIMYHFK